MRPPDETPRDETLSADALALLDAVAVMSSDLELGNVLEQIVVSACRLTGAQYGALGVIGEDETLTEFITHGLSETQREAIGELPHGRGILGLLIRHPQPLRLAHLQEHPESFGFPANHPPMTNFLGVPLRVRGTVFGNLYLTEKDTGQLFTEQDERLVEALASAAGVVIQNARAYALSERQRAWLEATARLEDALRPGAEVAEALGLVARAARGVSGARAVGMLHASEDGPLTLVTAEGRDADEVEQLVAGLGEQIGSAAFGEHPDPVSLSRGRRAVVVPLRAQLFGPVVMVVVIDLPRRDAGLVHTELDLIAGFADQAGLALDRSRALADRQQLAIVSDRDRIARDLHDLVIQRLFATGLHLQGVRGQVISPAVGERIDAAVADLDTTIRDIRATIFALQQHDSSSLRSRVADLVRDYAEVLGFTPALRVDGPVDTVVPTEVAEQLVAVLREGLSNAARHARPGRVMVAVVADAHALLLSVADDGVGLPVRRHESGLANARRRAVDLGGTLVLSDNDPSGTRMEWRVPLRGG